MKRWMAALLLMALLCGGTAQAKKKAEPEVAANPLQETTAVEVLSKVGAWMQPPENAALVSWWLIKGARPLGEMLFVLDNVEYSYRAQAAEEMTDISGMNYAFEPQEAVQIGGHEGQLLAYADDGESVGVVLWYDDDGSITYSLAMMSDASADTLLSLASTVYGQQGP